VLTGTSTKTSINVLIFLKRKTSINVMARVELLLKCGRLDCCVFVEDGAGSGRLKGGMALTPDPVLKKFGGLLRPMFLIELDPVLRGWWLSRLINASWLGVSSVPISGPTAGAPLLRQRRRFVLDSCGNGRL
jgi:hypothetical protein